MNQDIVKPNVIVICGPTALGKTSAALKLARVFNGEIIGADSMQVYRYMDIGTAKPTAYEQASIPHHMIDVVDPDESFSAMQYAKMAHKEIAKLYAQDITPFVVGGTGFYIKAESTNFDLIADMLSDMLINSIFSFRSSNLS